MLLFVILKGLIVGFLIAAPTGPTGIFCVKRVLKSKGNGKYLTGVGIALADSIYSIVAIFGISAISDFVTQEKNSFQILGASFLIGMGFWEFFGKKGFSERESSNRKKAMKDFFVGFFSTIVNPITIFSFFALYASFGLGTVTRDLLYSGVLVASTFVGSLLLWTGINFLISKHQHKFQEEVLKKMNLGFGAFFLLTGLVVLLKAIMDIF